MITGEIKNRIDSIWDTFWTGGITNSITILEQMTYLFFMKMLDDSQLKKEATANAMGVKVKEPVFKSGKWHNPDLDRDVPYESLRWHVFKNREAEAMFATISKDAFVFIKTLNDGKESAYSRFMDNATFLIPNARTLVKIVEGIDGLDMNNRDTMGDVYEYVLGKMAASGNNGQFRTPRHIIRMMVDMMEPNLNDTVCDPAMGSAGFIVEAAKFVQERHRKELLKKEKSDHYRNEMFHGFDTDQTMLRIGAMNLMLHGADNPDIAYRDSLSTDNTDENAYSLCLANPPFAGSLDYEAINKNLLAITKTNDGGTDKVWFYDMRADGYTLDQKRTECKENDIPDIVARWKNLEAEASRTRKDQSFFVPVEEIIANDYDLSINKYKEVEKVKVEYESPKTVFKRIQKLQDEINAAIDEFKAKYL